MSNIEKSIDNIQSNIFCVLFISYLGITVRCMPMNISFCLLLKLCLHMYIWNTNHFFNVEFYYSVG